MTFVLPLKTDPCPVHKDSPNQSPERLHTPVIQHCLDQCSVPTGSSRQRNSPDEDEFPILKESPAALKAPSRGQTYPLRMNPVPEEMTSASNVDSTSVNVSSNLQMLSSYVELLSNNVDLIEESTFLDEQMIPPPLNFCSTSDYASKNNQPDTELVDLSSPFAPDKDIFDITIRNPRAGVAPQTIVPVLRTFQSDDVGKTNKSKK